MNQNRNNNRRRGRGNNNRGGNGGGQMQGNRIDSRARGNAPQMLDKYKKLAHEASLNDDRVQTEYYLQFADHYFRVIADGKAQKDERQGRQDDREDRDYGRDDEDGDEDQRDDRQERGERQDRQDRQDRGNRQRGDRNGDARNNEGRGRGRGQFQEGAEGEAGDQQDDDNPFTRDEGAKVKKPRRRKEPAVQADDDVSADNGGGLDPAMLPPAIARSGDEGDEPVRKPRKLSTRRKATSEDDEPREAVG